jgi:hypothetical protein
MVSSQPATVIATTPDNTAAPYRSATTRHYPRGHFGHPYPDPSGAAPTRGRRYQRRNRLPAPAASSAPNRLPLISQLWNLTRHHGPISATQSLLIDPERLA